MSKPRHSRSWMVFIGCLILIGGLGIGLYLRPLPPLYSHMQLTVSASQLSPLAWPKDGEAAVGAIGYGVLASSRPQVKKPTASVAKLITALTVLKKYPLALGEPGPLLTLTQADVDLYTKYTAGGGSVVAVQAGESLSEYQVLQAMMLPSANNLADSLAIWAYGSLPAYASAANQLIQQLGLTNTVIGNDASGFDPSTTSTPTDLVQLGEAVLGNPVLAQIVAQKQATLPVAGTVSNVNWLLGRDGIAGIKTGNSAEAGGVYIFAAPYVQSGTTVNIIGTIMNTPSLAAALNGAEALLNSAEANFVSVTAVRADQVVASYFVPWSNTPLQVVAQSNVSFVGWRGLAIKPTPALNALYSPLPAGVTVGSLNFTVGSQTKSVPVSIKQGLPNPPWWWRIVRHKL